MKININENKRLFSFIMKINENHKENKIINEMVFFVVFDFDHENTRLFSINVYFERGGPTCFTCHLIDFFGGVMDS